MGAPVSSLAVAGAGTGSTPWAQRTDPAPTQMGETTTRSGRRASIRRHTAAMSAMASNAPTSWKWISETGTPWASLSALAMRS